MMVPEKKKNHSPMLDEAAVCIVRLENLPMFTALISHIPVYDVVINQIKNQRASKKLSSKIYNDTYKPIGQIPSGERLHNDNKF